MKKIQEKIKEFCKEHDLEHPPEHRLLDTMSELGEVAKEILKMSDYGKKRLEFREEIKFELGDVLYSLITLANYFNIDLEQSLEMVIKKYEKRLEEGSASSKSD